MITQRNLPTITSYALSFDRDSIGYMYVADYYSNDIPDWLHAFLDLNDEGYVACNRTQGGISDGSQLVQVLTEIEGEGGMQTGLTHKIVPEYRGFYNFAFHLAPIA